MRYLCVLLFVGLSVSACGGSNVAPTTPGNENMSGTWAGFSVARVSTFSASLAQNGSSITGTWSSDGGHGGQVSGSKTDTNVSLNFVGNNTSCSLTFTGTMSSLTALPGTLTGINCVNNAGGPLTLTKQ
jgi:hypothetical protein